MKLNDIISMVKDTTQKIGEKKTLKIKDIVLIPEYDRMRTISITIGGPKGEAVEEKNIEHTVDSLLSLSLPLGRESTVITALDNNDEEITIYSGGWFIDEEEEDE